MRVPKAGLPRLSPCAQRRAAFVVLSVLTIGVFAVIIWPDDVWKVVVGTGAGFSMGAVLGKLGGLFIR